MFRNLFDRLKFGFHKNVGNSVENDLMLVTKPVVLSSDALRLASVINSKNKKIKNVYSELVIRDFKNVFFFFCCQTLKAEFR